MLAAVDNLSHGLYTKSLSFGRGAELVEAERGFANLSLFTRHLIACFFIAQLTINTTYFICLQTAVPSQSPFGRQLSPRRASLDSLVSPRKASLAIIVKSSHSYISFSKANIIFSISSQTPLKFLSITLLGNRINVIPKFLKYSVLLSSYSTCFSS